MKSVKSKRSNLSTATRSSVYRRFELPAKPCSLFGVKTQWTGEQNTFKPYMKLIEGWLCQVGAGYLLNPDFQKQYKLLGEDYFSSDDFWNKYGISVNQARFDKEYLYGILLTSNRNRDDQFLLRNQPTLDGISTWLSFINTYLNNGCNILRYHELHKELYTAYQSDYPGALVKYLDNFGAVLEELMILKPEDTWTDRRKRGCLIENLYGDPSIFKLFLDYYKHPEMSYQETVQGLRSDFILLQSLEVT